MSDKINLKNLLIIVLGFFMAAIVAPMIVVVFETHYQQWLNDDSLEPEPMSRPQQDTIIIRPKIEAVQSQDLRHPDAPLTVTLWLKHHGKTKTQFHPGDEVTLYYQIDPKKDDNVATAAYFTLFNVAAADKWAILLENDKVEVGQLYSLPKGQAALQPGQNMGMDARLRLTAGHWHFNAIVTPEPITSATLDAANMATELQRITVWGRGALIVEVD
ncbi:MAG: hypothetical protein DRR19_21365 [Candidatus Parabeggiatoa sp. nov. 1]|nr:MAG: hypothetical protein DRR19_21365 [Gammaproteobacteria bacterium]